MKFRPASDPDCIILFNWRNDPITRANSHNTAPLVYEEHQKWFEKTLKSKNTDLYIYEEEDRTRFGTIRVDRTTSTTIELSWTVSPDLRGKGIGSTMLRSFLDWKKDFLSTFEVLAEIKPENKKSISIAENCNFKLVKTYPNKFVFKWEPTTDLSIIDSIQAIRGKNNVNWMDILRIAFKHAPEETREVFKRITDSDDEIGKLSRQLANNG